MNTQTAIEYRCYRTQGQAGVRGQGEVTDRQEGSGKGNGTQVEEDGLASRPSRFGVCLADRIFAPVFPALGVAPAKAAGATMHAHPTGLEMRRIRYWV